MIRIAVLYPNLAEAEFDFDYYQSKHIPLVKELYKQYGLLSIEFDTAVTASGKNKAPYLVIAYLSFNDMPAFLDAIKHAGKEVSDDVKNFTNIEPIIQISQSTTC